jgi:hypothetical protein
MKTVRAYSSFTTKDGKRITVRQDISVTRAVDILLKLTSMKGKPRGKRK